MGFEPKSTLAKAFLNRHRGDFEIRSIEKGIPNGALGAIQKCKDSVEGFFEVILGLSGQRLPWFLLIASDSG